MLTQIFNKFDKYSDLKLFVILLFISIFLSILGAVISQYIGDIQLLHNQSEDFSKFKLLAFGVILAPVFETFLFYYLPFEFLNKYLKPEYLVVIVPFLFGLQHTYSVVYIIIGIIVGFIFAVYYLYLKHKQKNAFLGLTLLHAAANLVTISLSFLD